MSLTVRPANINTSLAQAWDEIDKLKRLFAGGLDGTFGIYTAAPASVAAGVQYVAPWAYSGGATLLDLTTPTSPTVTADGLYSIGAQFAGQAPWTAGAALDAAIQSSVFQPAGVDRGIADVNLHVVYAWCSVMMKLSAGQGFQGFASHQDVAARSIGVPQMYIVRIG